MNPEELKIERITTQEPKLIKRKTFRYVSIPLMYDDEKISLLLKKQKFRIFKSDYKGEKTFCIGINLEEPLKTIIGNLEKRIQKLAMENQSTVKELSPSSSSFTEIDFTLRKLNLKSKTCSIYPKLYLSDGKINSPFFQLIEKNGRTVKKKVNPHDLISSPLEGDIVINMNQIFCGANKSITCIAKEALIRNETKLPSMFDIYEDEEEEED